jgi:hypothetical protein
MDLVVPESVGLGPALLSHPSPRERVGTYKDRRGCCTHQDQQGLIERAKGGIYLYYGACNETTHLVITNREELRADLDI